MAGQDGICCQLSANTSPESLRSPISDFFNTVSTPAAYRPRSPLAHGRRLGRSPERLPKGRQLGRSPEQLPKGRQLGRSPEQLPTGRQLGRSPEQLPKGRQLGRSPEQLPKGRQLGRSSEQLPKGRQLGRSSEQLAQYGSWLSEPAGDAERPGRLSGEERRRTGQESRPGTGPGPAVSAPSLTSTAAAADHRRRVVLLEPGPPHPLDTRARIFPDITELERTASSRPPHQQQQQQQQAPGQAAGQENSDTRRKPVAVAADAAGDGREGSHTILWGSYTQRKAIGG